VRSSPYCSARPDLASRALRAGMEIPSSLKRVRRARKRGLRRRDARRIFALLVEHAEDPGAILSDERARPLMDEISALQAAGERLYPSDASCTPPGSGSQP
jgi:hypothetical protein